MVGWPGQHTCCAHPEGSQGWSLDNTLDTVGALLTPKFLLYFFFFVLLFSRDLFISFKCRDGERVSIPWFTSQTATNSRDWARPKQQLLGLPRGFSSPSAWTIFYCLPRCIAGDWIRIGVARSRTGVRMGCQHNWQSLNVLHHMLSWPLFFHFESTGINTFLFLENVLHFSVLLWCSAPFQALLLAICELG